MKPYENRVVDRIVAILACFEHGESELKLMQICDKTGLNMSTVYRLLEVLRAHRLVCLDETSGSYHLGLRLFELGSIATGHLDLDRLAQPVLQELLYDIESGMPFLFVDQLVAQGPAVPGTMPEGKLRVLISVSGQWQGAR